jgi:hypothetical protein
MDHGAGGAHQLGAAFCIPRPLSATAQFRSLAGRGGDGFGRTLFSFSLSFDEFIRTLFVTGYDRTVPVLFWSRIVDELSPELPAMAVLIILVSATTSLFGVLASRQAARTSQGQA